MNLLLQEVHRDQLQEISDERIKELIDSNINEQSLVNLGYIYGDVLDQWIKTTLDEYLFHLKNETLDFSLVHQAEKLVFTETMLKHPYRFLIRFDEIDHNEDNVLVGI